MELPLSRHGLNALDVACRAAEEAGSLLMEHTHEERELTYKEGRSNIVTDVDLLVESRIINRLLHEFPEHNVLSEEAAAIKNDSYYTWIIDPLDGTNNYVHGIPFYSVSIALTAGDEVLLGVIYDPWLRELFQAERGRGALLNGQPISVSQQSQLSGAFVGLDLGYDVDAGTRIIRCVENFWQQMCGIRLMGSAVLGLAYVACGRLDLYMHASLYPWDVAAGLLLVQESGGKITDWDGRHATVDGGQVLAGNATIHRLFLKLMKAELQLGLPWI